MTKIDIDVVRPDASPWAHATVAVRLVDAGTGGAVEETVISGTQRVRCDDAGHAQIDLTPNADITPAGTFYAFAVEGSSPSTVRSIEVPAPNIVAMVEVPYSWADEAIQVLTDTPPVFIPAPSTGTAGQVVQVNATEDAYELGTAGGGAALSDATPQALGSAGPGASTSASRADHVHAVPSASAVGAAPTSRTVSAGTGLTGGGDLSANRTISADFGTGAGKVTEGNDARLSDARTPTAHAASHKAGGSDPLAVRLTFSNADYTVITTAPSTVVSQTGTLSAARVVTLPAANTVPAGAEVIVQTGAGCSGTNTLSIARAGSDTINGGTSSIAIGTAYAWRRMISDGSSAWTLDAGILRQSDLGVTVAAIASPTFTGTPAAPTAAAGTSTTQLATTAFVAAADNVTAPPPYPTESSSYVANVASNGGSTVGILAASGRMIMTLPLWLGFGTYDRIEVFTTSAAVATWRLGLIPSTASGPNWAGALDYGTLNMNATAGALPITITSPGTGWYYPVILVDAYTANPSVHQYSNSTAGAASIRGFPESQNGARTTALYWSGVSTGAIPTSSPGAPTLTTVAPVVRIRKA